jgi:signal transduction histidine kinase
MSREGEEGGEVDQGCGPSPVDPLCATPADRPAAALRPRSGAAPGISLRQRLYSLLLRWFVLFLVISGVVTSLAFSRFRKRALEDRLLLARTAAHYLDSTTSATMLSLGRLASQLPALDHAAESQMRSFRFQSLFREAIYVLDEHMQPVISDPPSTRPLPSDLLTDGESITPLFRKGGDDDRLLLAAIQPFRRDGRRYFLVAEMNPLGSMVSTFLQNLGTEPDMHVVVVDVNGVVLAAPDRKQLFRVMPETEGIRERIRAHRPFVSVGAPCSVCDQPKESADYLTVMAPLRFAPWGVVVQQQEREAFAALYTSQYGFLAAGALLIVMGIFLSRALLRSVVAPIQSLSGQAELLRRGDLSRPIGVVGDREIDVLATTMEAARQRLAATLGELQSLNEDLERKVASRTRVLEEQYEQRRILVRRLLNASEEERRRLARELHDEISQLLTVIQLSLDEVDLDTPAIRKARELLTRTQKEIHRIIHDLRPSLLDDLGLSAAVRWYAENYLSAKGIEVGLEIEEDLALPEEVQLATFRIFQEIITNVLRHSRAENVSIELYVSEGHLVLAVEDDGVGFDPQQKSAGAGLVGMRERAALVAGTITFDSSPGTGTQVLLRIPLGQ